MAAFSNGVKSWLIEKYAKQAEPEVDKLTGESFNTSMKTGEWRQLSSSSSDGVLQLSLIEKKTLMLSCGSKIRESFSLINTEQWLKTYCKGDSILFVVKIDNGFRRFRIKFANTKDESSVDNCKDFVNKAAEIFPIKMIPLPDCTKTLEGQRDTQINCTQLTAVEEQALNLGEIAKQITSTDQEMNHTAVCTNLPTTDISNLTRICLTDPGFPDFVAKVEEEIKQLIANERS